MFEDIASIIDWAVMGNAGCGIKILFCEHSLVFLQKVETDTAISSLLLFSKNVSCT